MTARLVSDRRKLTPEERKEAYAQRFRPTPALPADFDLGRRPLGSSMKDSAALKNKNPADVTLMELARLARENALPVLERLFSIAMMECGNDKELAVAVEAACQFLNRAGLYEVKGQVAAIYAKVQGDMLKIEDESEKAARTIEVETLTDGLGPKGTML